MISKCFEDANIRILSLGAGVQSSVMALMAAKGELLPKPDHAIFADTGWEPKEVYEHLDWLNDKLNFPVHIVKRSDLKEDVLKGKNATGQDYISVPFYTKEGGMGRRQCTSEYKLQPIRRKTRELLGLQTKEKSKGKFSETWIGISTDEIQRVKNSWDPYIKNRWPLLEKNMSRFDCLKWFQENYPNKKLSKSACIACPYHHDNQWKDMKKNNKEAFEQAVQFDKQLRSIQKDQQLFVHRSCVPLDEAVFNNERQLSFLDECEGMCGL